MNSDSAWDSSSAEYFGSAVLNTIEEEASAADACPTRSEPAQEEVTAYDGRTAGLVSAGPQYWWSVFGLATWP